MHVDYSGLFHHSSKDLTAGGTVHIPSDTSLWPEAWNTVHYKKYPRTEVIKLPDVSPEADLFDVIRRRRSTRQYGREPIPVDKLSALLRYTCGIVREGAPSYRAHPSGGGLFPLEVYPIIFRGTSEVPAGLYHYNVTEHGLDVLMQHDMTGNDISDLFVYPFVEDAAMALVITAVFARNQVKYGERGYRYLLLEAGHIGENAYLVAEALGLTCCGMGGTRDLQIEQYLDIDGITESVVYAVIVAPSTAR